MASNRSGPGTVAEQIAEDLVARGVTRVYGLCGGHVQPIWDALARRGVTIVDVRHEAAAVYMAHAEAELTDRIGVALVTSGPGLMNAVTAIANAHASQAAVLILAGCPPRAQAGRGAMQELPQIQVVAPLCRLARTVSHPLSVTAAVDAAIHAARGTDGAPGPACLDFPTDLLEERAAPAPARAAVALADAPRHPAPEAVAAAAELIASARRPLVVSGRGTRAAVAELEAFLERTGALYLDSGESRGALALDHPAYVPARRGAAMREADLIVTLGKRLNFQLAYGSAAVFSPETRFLRIGASAAEISDNRAPDAALLADIGPALRALVDAGARPADLDRDWVAATRLRNRDAVQRHAVAMASRPAGADGRMHPDRLIAAVNDTLDEDAIAIADGGDILSFARVGINARTYLDCGALGCLGVGVPFATAAALAAPGRRVVAVIGDGSFGFTAMEIDTAVRHGARAVFVVANNEGWNIERMDQLQRYDGHLVGVELPGCRYDLLGASLGAASRRVEDPGALPEALAWAVDHAPAVLDVLVTRDAASGDFKSGLAQVAPLQALASWNELEAASLELTAAT